MTEDIRLATPEMAPILKRLAVLGDVKKKIIEEEEALWVKLHPMFDALVGRVDIIRVPGSSEPVKKGEVIVVDPESKIEAGRSVSNFGSKLDAEKLKEALERLVKEGLITQEEFEDSIETEEVVTTTITVNEINLTALATEFPEVAEAYNKSLTDPDPRPSKVNAKTAPKTHLSYLASEVQTRG